MFEQRVDGLGLFLEPAFLQSDRSFKLLPAWELVIPPGDQNKRVCAKASRIGIGFQIPILSLRWVSFHGIQPPDESPRPDDFLLQMHPDFDSDPLGCAIGRFDEGN
jgi:hypothetical protein